MQRTGGTFNAQARAVGQADIERVARALKPERLTQTVDPALISGITKWGTKVLAELGSEARFDLRNPLVKDYLDSWQEQRIVGITEVTREELTRVMQDAVAEGVGIDEMRRRMRGYFESAADYRAERIARTEVVGSSNAANLAAYQISGVVDGKEWLAVQDTQTRETHADLDGQSVGIEDEFVSSSGARTQGPGLFGIGSEDINCRCTVRPVIKGLASPQGEARATEWRAYDVSLAEWQGDLRDGAAKAFGLWAGDAISALT